MSFPVLYLTGAPAAGKSSVGRALTERLPELGVFEYGERLTAHLRDRRPDIVQEDLREQSARLITPEDVAAVDDELLEYVQANRDHHPILIDSHAVTKEDYGYRITPFSLDQMRHMNPSSIALLYTPPAVAVQRIEEDPAGRPRISEYEAGFHNALQSSVAVSYAVGTRTPVYVIDSTRPREVVTDRLYQLLLRD